MSDESDSLEEGQPAAREAWPQEGKTRTCLRCGEVWPAFFPLLPTIARLQRLSREKHVSVLAQLENVPVELAAQWVRHEYHKACPEKIAHCARCGGVLVTWQARWCIHCKHDWHGQS